MTKNILLGLFILLMGVVVIVGYNFYKNTQLPVSNNVMIAVPQNAALILQEKNFKLVYDKISSTNIIWEELVQHTSSIKKLDSKISYVDSLFQLDSFKELHQEPVLTSMHLSGATGYDFIFYISIPSSIPEGEIVDQLKETTPSTPESRVYENATIFSIKDNNNTKISLTCYKNVLAFSYSNVLVEGVVQQLNSENSLLNDTDFINIFNTSGEPMDGNLFVNNKYFPKIIGQHLKADYKEEIKKLTNYSDWTELDISIKSNSVMLNGFSHSSDSSNNFLNLFRDQKAQRITLTSIVPNNVALIYYYGLSNSKQFFEDRKTMLKNTQNYTQYQDFIDEQTNLLSVDLEEEFLNNIGNELAFIITEPSEGDDVDYGFILFQTNNPQETTRNLTELSLKINKEPYVSEEFKGYFINKLDLPPLTFKQLIGSPFPQMKNSFYTVIKDYVVFGNSVTALKKVIRSYSFGKTLEKSENYQAFSENLSAETTIFIYNNIARSVNLYKTWSDDSYLKSIEEKIELYQKFEAVAFQINSNKKDFYYNNIYLKYNPIYKQDTRTLWETSLDTTVKAQPEIVINHNTNAKEIFVQDVANKVYLISNTGKVLWSKQLSEKIIGKTHQIDIFKNNKLQLLFNTKTKLYLLDRNGKDVSSFPVKLPANATNSLTPLDYSKNKNYRILIGCDNNMVYNYNTDGKLVDGWKYNSTGSPATKNIWHFALSGKDYIIIPLKNGSVKVIQRNGRDRLEITNKLPLTNHPVYLTKGNQLKSTYLLTTDSSGTLTKLYLNDQLETINLDSTLNQNFNFFDVNNDNLTDFIYTQNTTLNVLSGDKTPIFQTDFEQKITASPLHLTMLDNTKKIGIVTNNEIYLINQTGLIEDGFPLAGSTPFSVDDINNDNTLNLIVGDKNMIYSYDIK